MTVIRLIKRYNNLLIFCIFITLFIFLYNDFLLLYFSQDDFFHFKLGKLDVNRGIFDIFAFRPFKERGGVYFYRPIFRELLFKVYYLIVRLESFPFRLLQQLIQITNAILVYHIFLKLSNSRFVSLFTAGFYLLGVANVGILSYLAGGIQVLGMMLMTLFSTLFFMKYLEKPGVKFFILSFIFYVFALFSHEIALIVPYIFIVIYLFKKGFILKNLLMVLKLCSLFILTGLALAVLEFLIIGLPLTETQYQLSFSFSKMFNSYFWYSLWSLGMPEMLIDFVGPNFNINPNLMRYWKEYYYFILPSFLGVIIYLIVYIPKLLKDKNFFLFITWFIVGILPVVLVPFHKQYIYLALSLPAAGAILGTVAEKIKSKTFFALFIFFVLVLNVASIALAKNTYWAINRNRISKVLIDEIKLMYPSLPTGAELYILNHPDYPDLGQEWGGSSGQASVVLSGSDGLQMVYNDLSLRVYYEDLNKPNVGKDMFLLQPKVQLY